MTTFQLCIVCLTLFAIARTFARRGTVGDDLAPARVGHRVTVHTKKPDDQTIFGVLAGDYTDRIVLEDAEYVTALGVKPMPGSQHFATRDIAWIDVHALVAPVPDHAPAAARATPRDLAIAETRG